MENNNSNMFSFNTRYVILGGEKFMYTSVGDPNTGKMVSIHNINNVSYPVIQELGEKEQKIPLTIVMCGFGNDAASVESSYRRQKSVIQKLIHGKKVPTTLVLPDGMRHEVIIETCNPEYTAINKMTYTLECIVIPPSKQKIFKEVTYNEVIAASNEVKAKFLSSFVKKVASKWKNIKNCVNKTIQNIRDKVSAVMSVANTIIAEVNRPNQWLQQVNQILNDIQTIALTPYKIYNAITSIWDNVQNTWGLTKDTLKSITQSFDFLNSNSSSSGGSTSATVSSYNYETNQNNLSSNYMRSLNNMNVMMTYSNMLTQVPFDNNEELLEVKDTYNEFFTEMMNDSFIDFDVKLALIDHKKIMDSFFQTSLQNVKNIIIVNIEKPDNIINILFNRYGHLDYYLDILKLNEFIILDLFQIQGNIKMYKE